MGQLPMRMSGDVKGSHPKMNMAHMDASGVQQGAIKKTGTFHGKSNALGYGGRAAQLKARGVPEGVIGMLARKAGAAPGGPNYHGRRK